MNKSPLCLLALAFTPYLVYANASISANDEMTPATTEGYFIFQAYSNINKTPTPKLEPTISRSDPNQNVCWHIVSSTPIFGDTVQTTEYLVAPMGANFRSSNNAIAQISADGTRFTIHNTIKSINSSMIGQCWHFDPTDPIGEYQLTVEIDGHTMPTERFMITP